MLEPPASVKPATAEGVDHFATPKSISGSTGLIGTGNLHGFSGELLAGFDRSDVLSVACDSAMGPSGEDDEAASHGCSPLLLEAKTIKVATDGAPIVK